MNETRRPAHPEPVAIGVDIGATAIKGAVVGSQGNLLMSVQEPSPRSPSALRDFLHSLRRNYPGPVVGIGIGCKGVIDSATTEVKRLPGDLHFLEGRTLHDVVDAGDLPVCADNDARTALIAEVLWGAARGQRNVVLLTLGTGVGGAAMVDGVIVRGASGAACHLGHVTMDLRGGLCICGNYGCLETCFSSRSIESGYFAHLHRASPSRLSIDAKGQVPSTEAIFQAAAEGDPSARRVLELALESLAGAIASFMHIFDPELLILGGNIAAAGTQLLAPLQAQVAQRTQLLLGRIVPIVLQDGSRHGGVAGAAGLVYIQQQLLTL